MRKHLYLLTFIIGCVTSASHAQTMSIKEKINSIKTDPGFVWESCTWTSGAGLTEDSVLTIAISLLCDEINTETQREYTLKDLLPYIGKKKIKRGTNSVEFFVYAHKDSIAGGTGTQLIPPAVAKDRPTAVASTFTPLPLAKEIMAAGHIETAWNLLRQKKGAEVIDCGSMKQVADVSSLCIAVFTPDDRKPVCVLSPVRKDGKRQNLLDGSLDTLDRHRPCHAIWFLMSNSDNKK